MITKIPSVYPIHLPPIPKKGIPGEWLNLGGVISIKFNGRLQVYLLRDVSGLNRIIEPEHASLICEEFRAMARERRSPPTPKTK